MGADDERLGRNPAVVALGATETQRFTATPVPSTGGSMRTDFALSTP